MSRLVIFLFPAAWNTKFGHPQITQFSSQRGEEIEEKTSNNLNNDQSQWP
jgi:2-oxo-4-hydroxy-4-carboxy--5-ureidoimidazoline (OHCU) decarboxylase